MTITTQLYKRSSIKEQTHMISNSNACWWCTWLFSTSHNSRLHLASGRYGSDRRSSDWSNSNDAQTVKPQDTQIQILASLNVYRTLGKVWAAPSALGVGRMTPTRTLRMPSGAHSHMHRQYEFIHQNFVQSSVWNLINTKKRRCPCCYIIHAAWSILLLDADTDRTVTTWDRDGCVHTTAKCQGLAVATRSRFCLGT